MKSKQDAVARRNEWLDRLRHALELKQPFEYWREPKVLDATGLRRSSMRAMVAEGRFPPPVKLSERSSAWLSILVQEWQRRIAEQHKQAA